MVYSKATHYGPMYRQQRLRRTSSSTSITSSLSWGSTEDSMAHPSRPELCCWKSSSSNCNTRAKTHTRDNSSWSSRSCEGMTTDETRELWKCMVQLQRRYACYNSTRIDLAVNAGQDGLDLMPNPFIIDTLNNSIIDLPKEAREMLDQRLRPTHSPPKMKLKLKFWSRH